jgi:hypothetical protein
MMKSKAKREKAKVYTLPVTRYDVVVEEKFVSLMDYKKLEALLEKRTAQLERLEERLDNIPFGVR